MKDKPTLKKGKKMSIAKAGLIIYFTERDIYDEFDVGIPEILHRIVDVAEAKHCTYFTSCQVIARLRNSPYWDKRTEYGMYKGIKGNWRTTFVKPSEKGIEYFNKFLKENGK